jgi:ankyrin repeat protein
VTRQNFNWAANENGADYELLRAAEAGDVDNVRLWLDRGADINTRHTNNDTPLIIATREGHEDVVRCLLSRKKHPADTGLRNNEGHTALHVAARDGATVIALKLIAADTSTIDARDHEGATAAFYAAQTNNDTLLVKLAEADADLNLPDDKNTTPLMQAAKFAQPQAVVALLDRNVSLEARDIEGSTALMYGVGGGNMAIILALALSGAHIEVRNDAGLNAIDMARQKNRPEVAEKLQEILNEHYDPFHSGKGVTISPMKSLTLKPPGDKP